MRFIFLKTKIIKHTIRDNFPIFVNQFLPNLYNNTTTLLLGIFATPYLVGVYDSLKKVVNVPVMILGVVSRVFYPFLNRKKNAFVHYRKIMSILTLILFVLPIIFHSIIISYLNLDYSNSFLIIIILSASIIGYAAYDIYGLNFFIIRRQDKLVMRNTFYSSIIGFLLAFPLIYYFNIIGASINLLLARFFMGGGLFYKYHKIK